jgi:hypothetical protein
MEKDRNLSSRFYPDARNDDMDANLSNIMIKIIDSIRTTGSHSQLDQYFHDIRSLVRLDDSNIPESQWPCVQERLRQAYITAAVKNLALVVPKCIYQGDLKKGRKANSFNTLFIRQSIQRLCCNLRPLQPPQKKRRKTVYDNDSMVWKIVYDNDATIDNKPFFFTIVNSVDVLACAQSAGINKQN